MCVQHVARKAGTREGGGEYLVCPSSPEPNLPLFNLHSWVVLPEVLQRFRKGLFHNASVDVNSIARKDELIMIVLGGKHSCHVFVGEDPVEHAVTHHVGIEKIAVADFHPDPDWSGWAVRDQVFMKFPGAVRGLRIVGPLLIDECAGVGQHAAVKLWVIPSHAQGARTA